MNPKDNDDSMSGQAGKWLRDVAEADDNYSNLNHWVGKVMDEKISRVLVDFKYSWNQFAELFGYEDLAFEETKFYQKIIEKHTAINANYALKNEKWTMLKYFTSRAKKPEIKNLELVKWLINYISNPPKPRQIQISGDPNAGKTMLAFLLGELFLLADPENRRIVTNVESAAERNAKVDYVSGMDDFDEWREEHKNTEFFWIFDEANKHSSGTDHNVVKEQLFPLLTLIRKEDGHSCLIGHVGNDIHPWIQSLLDFVYKPSQKTAHIYETIDGDNVEGHIKTLRNLPTSSIDYNDKEATDWEWAEEKIQRCMGTNNEGGRCGKSIRIAYGDEMEYFCETHEGQKEPHSDVPSYELEDTPFEPEGYSKEENRIEVDTAQQVEAALADTEEDIDELDSGIDEDELDDEIKQEHKEHVTGDLIETDDEDEENNTDDESEKEENTDNETKNLKTDDEDENDSDSKQVDDEIDSLDPSSFRNVD